MPGYNIGALDIGAWDLGAEDDIGDDDVGARRRAVRRPVPHTPYGSPVRVKQQKAREYLYQAFGLGAFTAGGAGAGLLSQVFQEAFRPERLTLVETVAGQQITGIFVGVRPQLANLAVMPVAAFAAGAFETRVAFDAGNPGQSFVVNLNFLAAATVTGMAFGSVVK